MAFEKKPGQIDLWIKPKTSKAGNPYFWEKTEINWKSFTLFLKENQNHSWENRKYMITLIPNSISNSNSNNNSNNNNNDDLF